MISFAGNRFEEMSVPIAFGGRYFIIEQTSPLSISVVIIDEDDVIFEILKNQPCLNKWSKPVKQIGNIVTVADNNGKFLYKLRPGNRTSVIFGVLNQDEVEVRITDVYLEIGSNRIQNTKIGAGIVINIEDDGSFTIGDFGLLPPILQQLLSSDTH